MLCLFVILVRGGRIRSLGEEWSGNGLKALWLALSGLLVLFCEFFWLSWEKYIIGGEIERIFVSIEKDKELIK